MWSLINKFYTSFTLSLFEFEFYYVTFKSYATCATQILCYEHYEGAPIHNLQYARLVIYRRKSRYGIFIFKNPANNIMTRSMKRATFLTAIYCHICTSRNIFPQWSPKKACRSIAGFVENQYLSSLERYWEINVDLLFDDFAIKERSYTPRLFIMYIYLFVPHRGKLHFTINFKINFSSNLFFKTLSFILKRTIFRLVKNDGQRRKESRTNRYPG